MKRIALIGYGEVGRIFGAALAQAKEAHVAAFDPMAADAAWAAQASARATHDGVRLAGTPSEALAECDLAISAVTAKQTAHAGRDIARSCPRGAFVLDMNSASPGTKIACADEMRRAGLHYVEAAVMGPVPPHGLRVPMLLGGPHAAALLPMLQSLGFNASIGADKLGVVSAIKLCRSVMVKGIEALLVESLLSARRHGVEREVLASLAESYPGLDWERQATYSWRRVVEHGRRRAEEMREAAVTVGEKGIAPRMSTAIAETQAWIAAASALGAFRDIGADASWRELADRVPD